MDKQTIREYIKSVMQRLLLPAVYRISKKKNVNKNLVILADAHHDELPYSMQQLAKALKKQSLPLL